MLGKLLLASQSSSREFTRSHQTTSNSLPAVHLWDGNQGKDRKAYVLLITTDASTSTWDDDERDDGKLHAAVKRSCSANLPGRLGKIIM